MKKTTRMIWALLALCMLVGVLGLMPLDASAAGETFTDEATGLSYRITDLSSAEVIDYDDEKAKCEIPSVISYGGTQYVVNKISDSAFENCTILNDLIIPSTVANIDSFAFYGCTQLHITMMVQSAKKDISGYEGVNSVSYRYDIPTGVHCSTDGYATWLGLGTTDVRYKLKLAQSGVYPPLAEVYVASSGSNTTQTYQFTGITFDPEKTYHLYVQAFPLDGSTNGIGESKSGDGVILHDHSYAEDTGLCTVCGILEISAKCFPDDNFRQYVFDTIDTNQDGGLSTVEMQAVEKMEVNAKQIADLTGIGYFTNLQELNCYGNALTALDMSANKKLRVLQCSANALTALDMSANTNLQELQCSNNDLEALNVSQNTKLEVLRCSGNQLTSLSLDNNLALRVLNCSSNQLSYLDLRNHTSLQELYCENNNIRNIAQRSRQLWVLDCSDNQLTSLDVTANYELTQFFCARNQLTGLNLSGNTKLYNLDCSGNQLTGLDLQYNLSLQVLNCYNNQLTSLSLDNNLALTILNCSSNQLMGLDLHLTAVKELDCNNDSMIWLILPNHDESMSKLVYTDPAIVRIRISNDSYTLPAGMDIGRISNIEGATLKGDALTGIFGREVIYTYDTGRYLTLRVRLEVENPHEHTQKGLCTCGVLVIGDQNFPDANFRSYLLQEKDTDGDGLFTAEELAAVAAIDVSGKEIADLTGIEYFTAMTELDCSSNQLKALDVSKNTSLISLDCDQNQLTTLTLASGGTLTTLQCSNNQLTSLDVSGCSGIAHIYYGNNQLLYPPSSPSKWLATLDGDKQTVTVTIDDKAHYSFPSEMDVTKITDLRGAILEGNMLKRVFGTTVTYTYETGVSIGSFTVTLNVSNPHAHIQQGVCDCGGVVVNETNFPDANFRDFMELWLGEGVLFDEHLMITELSVNSENIADLTGIEYFTKLERLICTNNLLESLDVSRNTKLVYLDCVNNKLTSLDVSKNTLLQELWCDANAITSLDLSKNIQLKALSCSGNYLTSLDLSANTALTEFYGYGQSAEITIDRQTMTAPLPTGVDPDRIVSCEDATLNGTVLTVEQGVWLVSYSYSVGRQDLDELKVDLTVTNPHTHALKGYCECGVVVINDQNFPDWGFRSHVTAQYDADQNGVLGTSERTAVTHIHINGRTGCRNLSGIGYFTELTELEIMDQGMLETLDLSQNTKLTKVIGSCLRPLSTLIFPTSLTYLELTDSELESLDVSGLANLTVLFVSYNRLTALDVSQNTKLVELFCNDNQLQSLDLSRNTQLEKLCCAENQLESLDVSMLQSLKELYCNNNKLTELDLSQNHALIDLMCYDNQLTSLKIYRQAGWARLMCYNNHLTNLDLTGVSDLTWVFKGEGQTANISISRNSFDMTKIDPNFDGRRATAVTAGVSFSGNLLVLESDMATVVFTYDTGSDTDYNGKQSENLLTVTLTIEYIDYGQEIDALKKALNDAIDQMKDAITAAELQAAVDALTAAYAQADSALQQQITANAEAIASLKKTMEEADAALQEAIDKVAGDLVDAKADLQTQINSLKSGHETDIAALRAAITQLDEAYRAADTLINGSLADLENTDTAIKSDIADLETALNTAKSELEALIDQVQAELKKAKDELNAAIAQNKADLTAEIGALRAAMEAADALINEGLADLAYQDEAIRESITALTDALATVKSELETLIDQVQAELKKAKDELNAAIAQNKADLTAEIGALRAAMEAADALINEGLADLADQDEAIRESITALTDALATVKSELEALIDQVQAELKKAKDELNAAIAQNKADLTAEIGALRAAMEAADALINGHIAELEASLASVKADLETAIATVQANLDAAVENLGNAIAQNKTDLTAELKAVETELKNADSLMNGKLAELAAEDASIHASLSALESAMANTKTELKNAIDEVAVNLETAKSQLNAAIAAGDSDLDGKITALDTAYKAADQLIKSEIAELVADDTAIKGSVTALENSLASVKSELEAAIAQVQKNLEETKAALEAKDNELNDKITVLIVIISIVGVISVGCATVIVITLVKKRKA